MEYLHNAIEGISTAVSLAGIVVVLWGTVQAVGRFAAIKAGKGKKFLCRDMGVRQELGSHLLLGLEIFIAADIITSVANPTWEKVGLLGAIVAIRTVLSYFLTIELKNDPGSGFP